MEMKTPIDADSLAEQMSGAARFFRSLLREEMDKTGHALISRREIESLHRLVTQGAAVCVALREAEPRLTTAIDALHSAAHTTIPGGAEQYAASALDELGAWRSDSPIAAARAAIAKAQEGAS